MTNEKLNSVFDYYKKYFFVQRNPQHAARAALYTRFTPTEWNQHCIATYNTSDTNRNYAERMRNEAVRLVRETSEKTSQGQRDAGRRLGERLTDITFWRNELNTELEALVAEAGLQLVTSGFFYSIADT